MLAENKGYKFKFEYTQVEQFVDEHGPQTSNFRFVTYGDTAEEAIEGHKKLVDVWDKFMEKEQRGPYRNREDLK
jgi:hypothetical protein